MGRVFKSALCIVMVMGVLCLSFSVYAVDPAPTPIPTDALDDGFVAVQDAVMSYYIWLTLRAWGINIQYNEMDEFNDYVDSLIVNWVMEYLESLPSAYTISTWIAPWQASYDYWGNFRFNNSALEDMQDFADWLVDKFDLTDNETTIVDGVKTVNGATVYDSNKIYASNQEFSKDGNDYIGFATSSELETIGTNSLPYYCVFHNPTHDTYTFLMFRPVGNTSEVPYYVGMQTNGTISWIQSGGSGGWGTGYPYERFGYQFGFKGPYSFGTNGPVLPANFTAIEYANGDPNIWNDIYYWLYSLQSFNIEFEGNQKIVVTEMSVPIEGEDYQPGDSVEIVGDDAIYINLEWDGEVTVSNLPAIVSTGTVENPQLGNLFNWIPTFVDMASDSMDFFKQVIYMMPDQVLVCIFAVMGAGVLFGILRLMREH